LDGDVVTDVGTTGRTSVISGGSDEGADTGADDGDKGRCAGGEVGGFNGETSGGGCVVPPEGESSDAGSANRFSIDDEEPAMTSETTVKDGRSRAKIPCDIDWEAALGGGGRRCRRLRVET